MRILITGGSGFIGTKLVGSLIDSGHEVKIFDKAASERFPELVVLGDVRNLDALTKATQGADIVYHLAAEHKDDVRPASLYKEVNIGGAVNLSAACEQARVSRVVFTSSVAVYGLNAGEPSEDSPPVPFNEYSRTKYEAELIFRAWVDKAPGRSLTIVRPSVVFGEGNRGNVYNLVRQIATGRFLMVGGGKNRKSMAYVGNVVAFLAAITENNETGSRIFNYADKPDLTMREFVGLVRSNLGKQGGYPAIPYWLGMSCGACFDLISSVTGRSFPVSRIRVRKFCAETTVSVSRVTASDFKPPYTLAEGMSRFMRYEFGKMNRVTNHRSICA